MKHNKLANTLATMSLIFVLLGPSTMYIAQFIIQMTNQYTTRLVADVLFYFCVSLPIVGFLLSIYMLTSWNKLTKIRKGMILATFVLGNPLFLFINYIFCGFSSLSLVNIPWM